jgi:hypothetical protein
MGGANKRAVIINSPWMRRQIHDHVFKSETKYPLADFWWVFFMLNPDIEIGRVKVKGRFPNWVYYVEIKKLKGDNK